MQPLISVVLPTYNGERYIKESIESILKQTYMDWELIIVDDCSTDNTLDIIRQYEKSDDRIHIIHNKINQKLPAALNIGFKATKGEFLTWTSDDNVYHEKALDVMKRELEQNSNIYMVCAEMINIDEDGTETGVVGLNEGSELFFNNIIGACFLYRREVLQDIGEYDTELFLVEDYDYWLRIAECYGEIKRIFEPLYFYRRHKQSLSQTKTEVIARQKLKLRDKHIEILVDKFRNDASMICRLYFDYMERGGDVSKIEKRVFRILPNLRPDKQELNGKKVVILGAGGIGSQAARLLGDRAIAFADNNVDKIGTYKDGLPIISFRDMAEAQDSIQIMIAVSSLYIHELIIQLASCQIKTYSVYQCWRQKYEIKGE